MTLLFHGEFTSQDIASTRLPCDVNGGLSGTTGSLYVLEFSNGLIKVGRSSTPLTRVRSHVSMVASHAQARFIRGWLSDPHDNVGDTEAALVRFAQDNCAEFGGREFCWGASFPVLVAYAGSLPRLSPLAGPQQQADGPRWQLHELTRLMVVERKYEELKAGGPADLIENHERFDLPRRPETDEEWREVVLMVQALADDPASGMGYADWASASWLDMLEGIAETRVRAYEAHLRSKLLELRRRIYEEGRLDLIRHTLPVEHIPDYTESADGSVAYSYLDGSAAAVTS